MKKLMMVLVVMMVVVSCEKISTTDSLDSFNWSVSSPGGKFTLRLIKFNKHDYVVMDGLNQGGICHAESCPCNNK